MAASSYWGWSFLTAALVSTSLAFVTGYALTIWGLRRMGLSLAALLGLAFAADTVSILVMEVTDNAVSLSLGASSAHLLSLHFWLVMLVSLGLAFLVAWPVNRVLIARGLGHARVHSHHEHSPAAHH